MRHGAPHMHQGAFRNLLSHIMKQTAHETWGVRNMHSCDSGFVFIEFSCSGCEIGSVIQYCIEVGNYTYDINKNREGN